MLTNNRTITFRIDEIYIKNPPHHLTQVKVYFTFHTPTNWSKRNMFQLVGFLHNFKYEATSIEIRRWRAHVNDSGGYFVKPFFLLGNLYLEKNFHYIKKKMFIWFNIVLKDYSVFASLHHNQYCMLYLHCSVSLQVSHPMKQFLQTSSQRKQYMPQ